MWRNFNKLLSLLIPSLILAGFFALLICFINRWDSATWITVIPIWIWAGIGAVLSLISWLVFRSAVSIIILCLWLVAGIALPEETRALLRDFKHDVTAESNDEDQEKFPRSIRIVTINCHDGNIAAAREAIQLKPDIVLLQESPIRPEVNLLADEIFGGDENGFAVAHARGKNAILCRGEILHQSFDKSSPCVHARIRLQPRAGVIDLSNVHLKNCLPSSRLWRKSERTDLTHARIFNRRLLRSFFAEYDKDGKQPPRVVAGEFATPPGDDIFRPLRDAGLQDAYSASGKGWGNTFTTGVPYLRPNQIWMSPGLILLETKTIVSEHSDHRIVILRFSDSEKIGDSS